MVIYDKMYIFAVYGTEGRAFESLQARYSAFAPSGLRRDGEGGQSHQLIGKSGMLILQGRWATLGPPSARRT